MKINCYVQINAKGNPFDNTEGDVPVFFDKESAIVVDENINIKKAILIWGNDKNEVDQLQEKLLSQSKELENIRQIEKPIIEELLRTKLENSLIKKNFDVMVGNDSRQQEEIERLKGLLREGFFTLNRQWKKSEAKIEADWEKFQKAESLIVVDPKEDYEKAASAYAEEVVGEYSPELQQDYEDVKNHFLAGAKIIYNADPLKEIERLRNGIKWVLDNPGSVFVFDELKKLLRTAQ